MSKVVLVLVIFAICLVCFVIQTEATAYVYKVSKISPWWMLYFNHGVLSLVAPLQYLLFYRKREKQIFTIMEVSKIVFQINETKEYSVLNSSDDDESQEVTLRHQYREEISNESVSSRKQKLSEYLKSSSFKYIIKHTVIGTVLLSIASMSWYSSMNYSYANDVTAIFNCTAFFTYLFSIPILKEKFSLLKISSVVIATLGVFCVAYTGAIENTSDKKPYHIFGNMIILAGTVLYGGYDVYYKRYLCPPTHAGVHPIKEAAFSNFICSLIGLCSLVILLPVVLIFGGRFKISDLTEEGVHHSVIFYLLLSGFSGLGFFAGILALFSLTSPILGTVSSLTTIFLIGAYEWIVWGNALNNKQIFGDFLIMTGFLILIYACWKDISLT